ncbi:hypothetical protein [Paenibacillus methanolicus]|uniref:Uncharacterized protein n=1 Tax=Paenibacillus methanolicus TaxID=582686 RepID=A0A5S5CFQ7_9BACL|nr:hypothetical protein [Paenibacillus methanolicus]TYP78165.1 hypothetical protein BCM02_102742 [Paenibacillus methanolicus]
MINLDKRLYQEAFSLNRLVPLKIPSGWLVKYNHFLELDVDRFTDRNFPDWMDFDEDLLMLVCDFRQIIVDLGWYPMGDPKGQYTIMVVAMSEDKDQQADNWLTPLLTFRSRSLPVIQNRINEIMDDVTLGKL